MNCLLIQWTKEYLFFPFWTIEKTTHVRTHHQARNVKPMLHYPGVPRYDRDNWPEKSLTINEVRVAWSAYLFSKTVRLPSFDISQVGSDEHPVKL